MQVALKEWEVVVDALGRGEQILLLRKGGIHEDRGEFRVEHMRFVLFPTRYHQQRDCVIPSAQARFDEIHPLRGSAETVRLEYSAELVETRLLESLAQAEALKGQHIWREEVMARRFDWGKEKTIHVLVVRVLRLACAVEMPMNSAYGGCKSWIEVGCDITTDGAVPVLSDAAFERKLAEFHAALPLQLRKSAMIPEPRKHRSAL